MLSLHIVVSYLALFTTEDGVPFSCYMQTGLKTHLYCIRVRYPGKSLDSEHLCADRERCTFPRLQIGEVIQHVMKVNHL